MSKKQVVTETIVDFICQSMDYCGLKTIVDFICPLQSASLLLPSEGLVNRPPAVARTGWMFTRMHRVYPQLTHARREAASS